MLFELIHRPAELDCLGLSLTEAKSLEEWEAEGLLRRLHAVQKRTADRKSGRGGIGGVEDDFEDAFGEDREDRESPESK